MMRLKRITLPVLMLGLAACGGKASQADKDAQALPNEISDLRQQLATTSTTAASPTTAREATTSTTAASTTTTVKAKPASTPTSTAPAPTTTTAPSTTTTTAKYPQGIVSWSHGSADQVIGNCDYVKIHLINRSDTAVRSVTFHGPFVVENYTGTDRTAQARWGLTFPEQTVEAGLAPLGGTADVDVKWCPSTLRAGTTSWSVYYGSYKDGKDDHHAFISWEWFGGHGYEDCRGGCISYQGM
jgi:hypothetical protein